MLVKKYRSRVISVKNPFEEIYTLEFESLNGNYKYHPGQFLHLAIDSDYDGQVNGRIQDASQCRAVQMNYYKNYICC